MPSFVSSAANEPVPSLGRSARRLAAAGTRLAHRYPMRWKSAWLLVLLAGCDEVAPPYEELPLRDALRADPATVAAMSDAARARLAARFEAARSGDPTLDKLADDSSTSPQSLVAQMDRGRQRRQAEPMLLGVISQGAAWSIEGDGNKVAEQVLPALEGPAAGATAAIEGRALFGHAGVEVGILLAASGAHHLQRVVGWPAGAVAIDDTLYVNASWLVALAPGEKQSLDGGIDG